MNLLIGSVTLVLGLTAVLCGIYGEGFRYESSGKPAPSFVARPLFILVGFVLLGAGAFVLTTNLLG